MRKIFFIGIAVLFLLSCKSRQSSPDSGAVQAKIDSVFQNYFNERMQLYPLEATTNGINEYNNLLPVDISDSYRLKLKEFYEKYAEELKQFDRSKLDHERQISFDVLQWELNINLEDFEFHDNLMPVNQFWSTPITMGQLGSGSSNQPFKTVQDYRNFYERMESFGMWCDTAIANMKRGLAMGITPPKILMERTLPQMQGLISSDPSASIFYLPIKNMDTSLPATERSQLAYLYEQAIKNIINPSYQKLYDFIKDAYIPNLRETAGISNIPDGNNYYAHLAKQWTTTNMTPEEIFVLGQKEVARIRGEMEEVMKEVHFTGTLKDFFNYVHTDQQFFPYKTPEEVIAGYQTVYDKEKPYIEKLFTVLPKSKFEIRQTEAFRAASASAEYNPGTPDGSRPGIFYVPILDATKYNNLSMEDLFLHEAIPGHHFQMSLQMENTTLPDFRKYIWYGAYGEGWALYTESLGKELGLYTDPYQYFGSLSEEMHRAIRLVVDVGMHTKGWTREQAIQFSLENEAESEADITSEIERYMAIPGQALGYKIGQLKIIEIRNKAQQQLGDKFNIAKFHDEVLNDGCLPLTVFESKMNDWIAGQL